jgi:hypothetical protein
MAKQEVICSEILLLAIFEVKINLYYDLITDHFCLPVTKASLNLTEKCFKDMSSSKILPIKALFQTLEPEVTLILKQIHKTLLFNIIYLRK